METPTSLHLLLVALTREDVAILSPGGCQLAGDLGRRDSTACLLSQGILKASIHSIVDHHKLSGLTNAEPLEVRMNEKGLVA